MSVTHPYPSINWQQLTQALRDQRCVLLLGPDVCCDFAEAAPKPITRELAMHLSERIEQQNNTLRLIDKSVLSYVAAAFETAFEDDDLNASENLEYGRAKCRGVVKKFYEANKDREFTFYEKLANLPFHIIINTNHYDFFNKALLRAKKKAQTHYFNYRNPRHNKRLKFKTPTKENPLVYNLFGCIDDKDYKTESLVLTEADQIFFSENIVQKEATAALPSDLRALLLRKNQAQDEYIFLFLGFDFQEWHLRILLHFLFKHEDNQQKYTAIALQKPEDIHPLTRFLYEKHFSVDFHQMPPLDFLKTLEKELASVPPPRKPEPQGGKSLFILNHDQDDALRKELAVALKMLKRKEIINRIEHRESISHGIVQEEMTRMITAADIVVLIVTKQFLADDELYNDYLPLALKRHDKRQARVIPIIMSACLWETSDVDLTTALPKGGDPLNKQADRDEALTEIANDIEKIIDRFWKTP